MRKTFITFGLVINSEHEARYSKKKNTKRLAPARSESQESRPRFGSNSGDASQSKSRSESNSSVDSQSDFLNRKRLVVDANVLVLASVPESALVHLPDNLPDIVNASALFLRRCTERKILLYMLASANLEVFVGLWDYFQSGVLTQATMLGIFGRVARRKLEFRQVDLQRSFEIAVALKRTKKPQDAMYLALAESLQIGFVTNDLRLLNGVRQNKIEVLGVTPLELFS